MRRAVLRAFLGLIAPWASTAAEPAAGWPQYRGDAGHTGVSSDNSVKPPLKLLWSYRTDTDTSGYGGMGFTKNLLLVSGIRSQYGTDGAVAVDLDAPGEEPKKPLTSLEGLRLLATKGLGGRSLSSMGAPLGIGEAVGIAAVSGEVSLVGLDGRKLWSARLGGTCHSPPVAAAGTLVVGCDDGNVYAFRVKR